jgi:hypothetical protein
MSSLDLYQHSLDAVGARVITVTNEDEPPKVGKIVGYEKLPGNCLPLVKMDDDGVEYICFSVLVPYSDEMLEFLSGLDHKRRWEIMADFSMLNQTVKRVGKEGYHA